ncbi:hypothetical protein BaRGS_00000559 [Batillaria attramentaria]|uniref:Uncharacterized protein n=1 Tax=Batillaria attramentaria TaxID=370345 RepID=A0ABD0MA49_9CAEN
MPEKSAPLHGEDSGAGPDRKTSACSVSPEDFGCSDPLLRPASKETCLTGARCLRFERAVGERRSMAELLKPCCVLRLSWEDVIWRCLQALTRKPQHHSELSYPKADSERPMIHTKQTKTMVFPAADVVTNTSSEDDTGNYTKKSLDNPPAILQYITSLAASNS